jgi:hypothetical protein
MLLYVYRASAAIARTSNISISAFWTAGSNRIKQGSNLTRKTSPADTSCNGIYPDQDRAAVKLRLGVKTGTAAGKRAGQNLDC